MQPPVMNHCRILSENRRLYRGMPGVGKTTTERDLNDVLEVELNFVGFKRIRKSIERLFQFCFKIFDGRDDSFHSRLVDHTARSINEQMEIFVKFDFRWKLHRSLTGHRSLFGDSIR